MDQATSLPNIVNGTDPLINSTKPSDTLHPYYYTTFQEQCTKPKTDPPNATPIKDRLPIPQKFKDEAERISEQINSVLIQDLRNVAEWTSVIPSILFEKYGSVPLQRYLIDRAMARTMGDARIINWIPSFKMLYPTRTLGNGNCLLHAVLIAMVGIHDLSLNLRDRLSQFIDENKDLLKVHWQMERLKSDKSYGISSEQSKLDDEWNELCFLVHYEKSSDGQTATNLSFLEAVHVFSISNMLRRPIIVLSEDIIRNKNGEAISVNDLFGIYLPILSQPEECIKEPIILAYDRSHFCPLQTSCLSTDRTSENLLPLYLSIEHLHDQHLLPIRFLGNDGSAEHSNDLLRHYLYIEKVNIRLNSTSEFSSILCAKLGAKHTEIEGTFFSLYHKYLKNFFEIQKPQMIEDERQRELQRDTDDYISRYASYGTNNGQVAREDQFLSSLSPLSSSRTTNGLNNTPQRNQIDQSYEQVYSSGGAYIPNNGAVQFTNYTSVPRSSERLPTLPRISRPTLGTDQPRSDQASQHRRSDSANITNTRDYNKVTNQIYIDTRDDGFHTRRERLQPQQNMVSIPVQISSPRLSSNNQNTPSTYVQTISAQRCSQCRCLFYDYPLKTICADCESSIHTRGTRYDAPSQTSSRFRSTNTHTPSYDFGHSSFISSIPKASVRNRVICPHCNNSNINYTSDGSQLYCSVCQWLIPSFHRNR